MIRTQKTITTRYIKSTALQFDILMFLVFEKQNIIKFVQKSNYKNTIFSHVNFICCYN